MTIAQASQIWKIDRSRQGDSSQLAMLAKKEATEETLQPGGSFGQPAALGIDSRSRVSARAVAPSKVYVIPQDALLASFASLPEALHAMRQHVDPGWRLTY